jgi:hypothetical protein
MELLWLKYDLHTWVFEKVRTIICNYPDIM